MSDDRLAQARAEAERRYGRIGVIPQDALFMFKTGAFVDGAEWADANPHSTPEALAAAYEDGQRDAVEKGLASPQPRTITRDQARTAKTILTFSGNDSEADKVFAALGIEVVDDE